MCVCECVYVCVYVCVFAKHIHYEYSVCTRSYMNINIII